MDQSQMMNAMNQLIAGITGNQKNQKYQAQAENVKNDQIQC